MESEKEISRSSCLKQTITIVPQSLYYIIYIYIKCARCLGDCVEKEVVNPVRQKGKKKV